MSSPADLPDDIAALKALIAERDAALAHKDVVVTDCASNSPPRLSRSNS
jgi:hypothetical protein